MDSPPPAPPPLVTRGPPDSRDGQKLKKAFVPLGVLGVLLLKFKALLLPALKFFPLLLKTGGTMFLSIWIYAQTWGWWYALGFVLLLFVHECGHLLAARRIGLRVGAPVFIPFMGAFIALKDAPPNAWIEAQVGIGGPLLGTAGAALCVASPMQKAAQDRALLFLHRHIEPDRRQGRTDGHLRRPVQCPRRRL